MNRQQLQKIKELYQNGENLMAYFRKENMAKFNDTESILISYDFQAGTYIAFTEKMKDFNFQYTSALAKIIEGFNPKSILEVGVGEATTFKNVIDKIASPSIDFYGFDLAWSRVRYAQQYCQDSRWKENITLFTADLFNMPLQDNSIDVVYTSHSIEPNGGKEQEALEEIYRVATRYVVLLEPCYELAAAEAQKRMLSHGYVTKLQETIRKLGYKVIDFKLFNYTANPLNPTGLTIIEKNPQAVPLNDPFACPITCTPLTVYEEGFYASQSLLAYPKLMGVPCLLPDNAIVASHFEDFC